ncbi:hypothetical protein D3C80_2048470 [compost metagenome]
MAEQIARLFQTAQHALGHAVVQLSGDHCGIGVRQVACHVVGDPTLQALDVLQAAVVGDVAGLGSPWRNRAQTRYHQEQAATWLLHRDARTVLE